MVQARGLLVADSLAKARMGFVRTRLLTQTRWVRRICFFVGHSSYLELLRNWAPNLDNRVVKQVMTSTGNYLPAKGIRRRLCKQSRQF